MWYSNADLQKSDIYVAKASPRFVIGSRASGILVERHFSDFGLIVQNVNFESCLRVVWASKVAAHALYGEVLRLNLDV